MSKTLPTFLLLCSAVSMFAQSGELCFHPRSLPNKSFTVTGRNSSFSGSVRNCRIR